MSEKHDGVNKEQNLLQTIPTIDSTSKEVHSKMPEIRRRNSEKRTVNFGVRITPSIFAKLNRISELENASKNSVITWLIEVEANKRGL